MPLIIYYDLYFMGVSKIMGLLFKKGLDVWKVMKMQIQRQFPVIELKNLRISYGGRSDEVLLVGQRVALKLRQGYTLFNVANSFDKKKRKRQMIVRSHEVFNM